jgi:hypothetical protein
MRETPDLHEAGHSSGWRADWNIADLLRAASAGEVIEEPSLIHNAVPAAVEATWAETWDLIVGVEERLRRNERRLAELEAANAELEGHLARQVLSVSSRMKLLEAVAERAEAARATAEAEAERAEARAGAAKAWLNRIADAVRYEFTAVLPRSAPARGSGPVFPTGIAPQYAHEPPAKARLHTCLEQYKANKEADANGGLRWIEPGGGYFSACNNRLKLEPA